MIDGCTLILTCDQKGGLAFNHRRQRQNKIVITDVLELADQPIYIRKCSKDLFAEGNYVLFDDILDIPNGQFVFEELGNAKNTYHGGYREIILYRWQQDYNSDTYLPKDVLFGYVLESTRELEICSEEFVTVERYRKKEP